MTYDLLDYARHRREEQRQCHLLYNTLYFELKKESDPNEHISDLKSCICMKV